MNKFHRILALAAIAAIPTGVATAQGVYGPYNPTTPVTPTTPPVVTPTTPLGESTPLTPQQILANNLRKDAAAALAFFNTRTLKSTKKKKPTLEIGIDGAGTYSVELTKKIVKSKGKGKNKRTKYEYPVVASGSVTTKFTGEGSRDLKLTTTEYGKDVLKDAKGDSLTLHLRSAFEPLEPKSAKATWSSRQAVEIDIPELKKGNAKVKADDKKKTKK